MKVVTSESWKEEMLGLSGGCIIDSVMADGNWEFLC